MTKYQEKKLGSTTLVIGNSLISKFASYPTSIVYSIAFGDYFSHQFYKLSSKQILKNHEMN